MLVVALRFLRCIVLFLLTFVTIPTPNLVISQPGVLENTWPWLVGDTTRPGAGTTPPPQLPRITSGYEGVAASKAREYDYKYENTAVASTNRIDT